MKLSRVVVLLVLLAAPLHLFAQATTGTLVGTAMSEGQPLPGVGVTISSPSLQGMRSAVSGDAGGYAFPALPPGDYTVTFELAGMQTVKKHVTVNVSQTSRADAALKVSTITEALTVTAAAPPAVETSEVATNFSMEQINQLPVGRTIDETVQLAPGVTEAGPNDQITISG